MNRIKYSLFFLLLSISLFAQKETVISGRVTEIGTNNGVPFANIYFKGTFQGTVTDFDGQYVLKTTAPKDSIFVSLIGYKSKAKPVKKGTTQTIDFQLSPEALNLNTIEVRPGVNPALRIIKNAQDNKDKYNRDNLESVQYTSYTKQEADVDNVTPKMRKWRLFRGFTNMWDSLDQLAGEESKANLPVMMSEVISDIYSYKVADKKREEVSAVKIKFVGMKDGSAVSQLTGTDFQNYNFGNNVITLQAKDILNPIADNAMLFYNYYLIDSMVIDGFRCYRIDCRPKNKKDLAFTGSLWITDTTFAIKQLDLEITPDVNFNWLDRAR
ncbi:MAG: carboxypeptidase-like regulatory domain-containing protein, partial [Bacteroidia bacterium]|nr:carboxypeptidase-like regulatory domain-containing protein [Bacteroidia bacterium]